MLRTRMMGSHSLAVLIRHLLHRGSGMYAAISLLTAHLAGCAAFFEAEKNLRDNSYTVRNQESKCDPVTGKCGNVVETKTYLRDLRGSAEAPSSSAGSRGPTPEALMFEGRIAEYRVIESSVVRLSAVPEQLLAVLANGHLMRYEPSPQSFPVRVAGIEGAVDVAQSITKVVCIRYADRTVACGPQTSPTSISLTKVPNLRGVDSLQMTAHITCASGVDSGLQCWQTAHPKPFAVKGASTLVGPPFVCRNEVCVKRADGTQIQITPTGETVPSPSNFEFLEKSDLKKHYLGATACTLSGGSLSCKRLDTAGQLSRFFNPRDTFSELSSELDTDVCAVDSHGEVQCLADTTIGETRKVMLKGRPLKVKPGTLRSSAFGVCAVNADLAKGNVVCWRTNVHD